MKPVRLALSGSGFLAPIHAGALCAFLEAGVPILEVAGTSGGSIAAALLASGCTPAALRGLSMSDMPDKIMALQPLGALWRWAMNDGKVLHAWLRRAIGAATFEQAKIPVTIVASDTRAQRTLVFNRSTTPTLALADACRMSASVPFVWAPVRFAGTLVADGGMCANIPTDKLSHSDDTLRVGVQIVDGTVPPKIDSLLDYAKGCIGTMLNANENNLVAWAQQTGAVIIQVDAKPYGFLDAKLTPAQRLDLFSRGHTAVRSFLRAHGRV